jgi:hypothetical protein
VYGVGALYSKTKTQKRWQGAAQAECTGGDEWHYLDFVFRFTLVTAAEGVLTLPDLPPILPALGQKKRHAEDIGCIEPLSRKPEIATDVEVADGIFLPLKRATKSAKQSEARVPR